jgi:hypothetical protein
MTDDAPRSWRVVETSATRYPLHGAMKRRRAEATWVNLFWDGPQRVNLVAQSPCCRSGSHASCTLRLTGLGAPLESKTEIHATQARTWNSRSRLGLAPAHEARSDQS